MVNRAFPNPLTVQKLLKASQLIYEYNTNTFKSPNTQNNHHWRNKPQTPIQDKNE